MCSLNCLLDCVIVGTDDATFNADVAVVANLLQGAEAGADIEVTTPGLKTMTMLPVAHSASRKRLDADCFARERSLGDNQTYAAGLQGQVIVDDICHLMTVDRADDPVTVHRQCEPVAAV
jgi:hypothetical protein